MRLYPSLGLENLFGHYAHERLDVTGASSGARYVGTATVTEPLPEVCYIASEALLEPR